MAKPIHKDSKGNQDRLTKDDSIVTTTLSLCDLLDFPRLPSNAEAAPALAMTTADLSSVRPFIHPFGHSLDCIGSDRIELVRTRLS